MDEQALRAKELFKVYNGSTFHMYREGRLDEYKGYDIAQPLEAEWFNEMIDECSKELSIRDWKAVERLESIAGNHPDPRILKNVLAFATRNVMSSDSLVKLKYAESMFEIARKLKSVLHKEQLIEAYKATFIFLDDKPLVIDPGHELENHGLKDKKSLNDRAKRSVEKIKEELGRI